MEEKEAPPHSGASNKPSVTQHLLDKKQTDSAKEKHTCNSHLSLNNHIILLRVCVVSLGWSDASVLNGSFVMTVAATNARTRSQPAETRLRL